ncbi:hypothetical protein [Burkholderia multivorans]|uniref:hypothetical protein n=1 Tax=Burkholderia multivorans TaxID=87883 RepID=UPI0011B1EE64|nr:hypothetical protein [Burkholderia multivorans]
MKKTRVFKPVRAEHKPSTRWLSRPSVERERWRRFAESAIEQINESARKIYGALSPKDAPHPTDK